jgi:hypothetical protein
MQALPYEAKTRRATALRSQPGVSRPEACRLRRPRSSSAGDSCAPSRTPVSSSSATPFQERAARRCRHPHPARARGVASGLGRYVRRLASHRTRPVEKLDLAHGRIDRLALGEGATADGRWLAHSSLASARASSRSVFARACRIPVSLGETTITRATYGSMMRAIAHALPVTSSATRSLGSRLCANNSNATARVAIRPPERSRPSATIATSQSRDGHPALPLSRALLPSLVERENGWANDIDGSALAACSTAGQRATRRLPRPPRAAGFRAYVRPTMRMSEAGTRGHPTDPGTCELL